MAFEVLFNKPCYESDLLDQVAEILQAEYDLHQNVCYFLKLRKSGKKESEILWQKPFSSLDVLSDFTFNTIYRRACILVKFETDKYKLVCFGFSLIQEMIVCPYSVEKRPALKAFGDIEEKFMPPRELLKGFDDITGCMETTPLKKAM